VSEEYKGSGNCRKEATYISAVMEHHGIKLIFVMMNENYTTSSKVRSYFAVC
jgi:hypothetical protein